jgi:hypothetical protein
MLFGFVVPMLAPAHPIWETDRDCGPVTVAADHQTKHFEAVLPPVADEHCALCHWLRSVGGASTRAAMVAVPGLVVRTADASRQDRQPLAGLSPQQPSRAPPVTPPLTAAL